MTTMRRMKMTTTQNKGEDEVSSCIGFIMAILLTIFFAPTFIKEIAFCLSTWEQILR
jgi:hypothetical protein